MKIRIVSVGKISGDFYREGIENFLARMGSFAKVEHIIVKSGDKLLDAARGFVIALDPGGREFSSEEFAATLKMKPETTLLVGPAEGMTQDIREGSDLVLSLSQLTMQHDLALLVLCEQVYRALTILKGHPYHKK